MATTELGPESRGEAFYGALSDVEYWVRVIDTETGKSRRYHNPPGTLCGLGDIEAF